MAGTYLYRITEHDGTEILLTESMANPLKESLISTEPYYVKLALSNVYTNAKEIDCLEVYDDDAKHILSDIIYDNIINSIKKYGDSKALRHITQAFSEMRLTEEDDKKPLDLLVREIEHKAASSCEDNPNIFSKKPSHEKETMYA